MATMKINYKVPKSTITRTMALMVNGEKIASNSTDIAAEIAKAKGTKNNAPYSLESGSQSLKGAEFEAKATNTIEFMKMDASKNFVSIKGAKATFEATDSSTVKVTIKKRNMIFGMIFGKYALSIKVK